MACRVGITTRPNERRQEWQLKYPNLRNWQTVGPFPSRQAAQGWEDSQTSCERSGGGNDPDNPSARWYGYSFNF